MSPVTSRPGPDAVRAAYEQCEQITGSQAKYFSYGIKLLPAAKRQALSAVYAFARRVDDICDGDLPAAQKVTELAEARAAVLALSGPGADPDDDPVLIALHDAAGRFPIPLAAFGELIEGVELDVRGATCTSVDDLVHYCRCVAGSVGRLSLGVFTAPDLAVADIVDAPRKCVNGRERGPLVGRQQSDAVREIARLGPGDALAFGVGERHGRRRPGHGHRGPPARRARATSAARRHRLARRVADRTS